MAEDYLSAIVRDAVSAMEAFSGAIDPDLSIDDFPLGAAASSHWVEKPKSFSSHG